MASARDREAKVVIFKGKHGEDDAAQAESRDQRIDREKDDDNMKIIKEIAFGMLDYFAWKQDSSMINEAEFNELVELSAIKDPQVYHLLLQNVFRDVADDVFPYPHKLKGLAIIILNLALKLEGEEDYSRYVSGDDLNACLRLMKNKMDSMLVDSESYAIQECLDAFNLILNAMCSIGLTGVREEEIAEIGKSLVVFEDVSSHRDPLPIRLLGLTDKYSGVDRSLFMKSRYTEEALSRIGKARPAWTNLATYEMRYNHMVSAISGAASIVKGLSHFDAGAISEGIDGLGPIILFYTRDK